MIFQFCFFKTRDVVFVLVSDCPPELEKTMLYDHFVDNCSSEFMTQDYTENDELS